MGDHLRALGWQVMGCSRGRTVLPDGKVGEPIALDDRAGLAMLVSDHRPEHIYYLAAHHASAERRDQESLDDLLENSLATNVLGLANILSAAHGAGGGARVLYAASSHVFGVPDSSPQSEKTPFRPVTPYGVTKAAGIGLCRCFRATAGLFASSAIMYNHESALRPDDYVTQKIAAAAAAAHLGGDGQLVLRDLGARVDWGAAADYVAALHAILLAPEGDDFVVASGQLHTVADFAALAFSRVGLRWSDFVSASSSGKPAHGHALVGDASKLKAVTGWAPATTLEQLAAGMVDAAIQRLEAQGGPLR